MTNLPPRFREDAFRRYELALHAAVQAWPKPVVIDPHEYGLAATTVAHRARDARTSLIKNRWTTVVDLEKLFVIGNAMKFIERQDGMVEIGPARSHAKSTPLQAVVADAPTPLDLTERATFAEFITLFVLAHERALSRPLLLKMQTTAAELAMQQFDINLEPTTQADVFILT